MNSPDPTSDDGGVTSDPPPAGSGTAMGSGQPFEGEELLPLVDSGVLEDLEEQLNGSELAVRFARDYTAMWDQRYTRLAAAVQSEDRASALDAAISLKITSAMVGGARLARLAEIVEKLIRKGDFDQGQALLEQVAEHGEQTISELQANYILKNG